MVDNWEKDFRYNLMKQPQETIEVSQDPLFGFGPFPDPQLSPKNSKFLYSWLPHSFSRKHIQMKLDFLPDLISRRISNPQLNVLISQAERVFNEKLDECGIRQHRINYGEAEDVYKGTPELGQIMKELGLTLRGSSVRDCIEVAKVLSNELFYFMDLLAEAPLWSIIEEQLDFNLHILSFQDRTQAQFALTFRLPKKCSFDLRQRLVGSLLNTNFEGLSLQQMMQFSNATRNEKSRDFCHYKFYENLLKRANEINSAPLDSSLPVDILYSFFNNKIQTGKRKKLRFADEETEEEMNILELLAPAIRERIPILSVNAQFRLLSALSISRVNGYSDLEHGVLKTFRKQMAEMDPDVVIAFLKLISEANYGVGIGDKNFWNAVQTHVQNNIDRFLEVPDLQLQFELFKILALQRRLSLDLFTTHFAPKVNEYMSGSRREWDCLYNIAKGLTSLNLTFPRDQRTDLTEFTKLLQFSKRYWNTRQHYFFKMFQCLQETRQPEWDLSAMDTFGYHAEKEFDIWRLKASLMTPELKQVLSVCQTQLEMKLLPLVDYKNTFLIDLANPELKFAVVLRTNAHTLSSQRDPWDFESTSADLAFYRQLQKEILVNDAWHVYELDFQVFKEKQDKRAEWLLGELQREFATAVEKRPDPYAEQRKELEEYIEFKSREELEHIIFELDKDRLELLVEEDQLEKDQFNWREKIEIEDLDLMDLYD